MKTLYIRIVVTFVLIAMVSGCLALFMANLYYKSKIKDYREQKVLAVSKEIRTLYEQMPGLALDDYLRRIAALGYQMYAVDADMKGTFYGSPFRNKDIAEEHIRRVLAGEVYQGILEKKNLLMVTGYFENSVASCVGIPLQADGQTYALFIRPDLEQQFGDVRILLAVLLGVTFLFSLVFIVIFTRYIVKPVQKLTHATKQIVGGDYNIGLDVARRDEIGNLARHFAQMARSLERLDEMRQQFVANVSHEIQSPLTSIQGFVQAILEHEATPGETERYLHIIDAESRRLSSLSKQLLTLAALDNEANALKRSEFRLDEQIRQVVLVMEWQWTEKKLAVELDLPELIITGDQQLLHQVWLNLITNSIKFSNPGDTIRIGIAIDQEIVVTVSDTGIGMPESELPHIFERFYKADKARTRTRSGSGLGLSIVKKIVDLHRGIVDVHSELGEGTTFVVRLPLL